MVDDDDGNDHDNGMITTLMVNDDRDHDDSSIEWSIFAIFIC